jgi:hypothetical protein
MCRKNRLYVVMLLTVLLLSACQPIQPAPAAQQAEGDAMSVMDQFFAAYSAYDVDKLLWLCKPTTSCGRGSIPARTSGLCPEGVRADRNCKDEIRRQCSMMDRGQLGDASPVTSCGPTWRAIRSERHGTVGERVHKGHRRAD